MLINIRWNQKRTGKLPVCNKLWGDTKTTECKVTGELVIHTASSYLQVSNYLLIRKETEESLQCGNFATPP